MPTSAAIRLPSITCSTVAISSLSVKYWDTLLWRWSTTTSISPALKSPINTTSSHLWTKCITPHKANDMAKVSKGHSLIVTGRPRLEVDFALVLRLRDVHGLGWSRMAEAYQQIKGYFVSRETMKRRYYEVKGLKTTP